MINEKEFNEWLDHPVTRAVKEMYADKANELKDAWAAWNFVNSSAEAYAIQNAGEVGRCNTYLKFSTLSYEDYQTEKHDGESIGAVPAGESGAD